MRYAIRDMIKNPPVGFEDVVKNHFKLKKEDVKLTCKKWVDIYNTNDYKKVYEEVCDVLDTL